MSRIKGNSLLVGAATISAELGEVSKIAKCISIDVKNAKAIAARAGDDARGFQPITDFINEMALEMISLVSRINFAALEVTRSAVTHGRSQDAYQRLMQVVNNVSGKVKHIEQLEEVAAVLEQELNQKNITMKKDAGELKRLLEEIILKVKAAKAIVHSSRIESVRAVEYRHNLETVAASLEVQTKAISDLVSKCQSRLQELMENLK